MTNALTAAQESRVREIVAEMIGQFASGAGQRIAGEPPISDEVRALREDVTGLRGRERFEGNDPFFREGVGNG